jgi:lipopolysaccharide/colanic/teichoic acid biosynthesis glycosyltransferase
MASASRHNFPLLLIGDVVVLAGSLWISLALRYLEVPSRQILELHASPFAILIGCWLLVLFIAGLYERQILVLRNRLLATILNAQIANSLLAVAFFYFVPYFGVTPKTNLFIYLATSSVLLALWRLYGASAIAHPMRVSAVIIGDGPDAEQLEAELSKNKGHGISPVCRISVASLGTTEGVARLDQGVGLVIADLSDPAIRPHLPTLYEKLFTGTSFATLLEAYESVFKRVPLSLLSHDWFIENVSAAPKVVYDAIKRFVDVVAALAIGIPSLVFYPFAIIAIKIEDGGAAFITQERVGRGNRPIYIYKFRSMNVNDAGKWVQKGDSRHTTVGKFLRKSRIDELPQLWNVLRGDLSLIGPRPDVIGLWKTLSNEIPYYATRSIVKPGLSGWAQISQDLPPQTLEETKVRLSYDLYYVKHRSLLLDIKIGLRTIKTLLSRTGL